jgi:hypothetical protein
LRSTNDDNSYISNAAIDKTSTLTLRAGFVFQFTVRMHDKRSIELLKRRVQHFERHRTIATPTHVYLLINRVKTVHEHPTFYKPNQNIKRHLPTALRFIRQNNAIVFGICSKNTHTSHVNIHKKNSRPIL